MDSVTKSVMETAAERVEWCEKDGMTNIHTVTVILNGQHGGADVVIEGEWPDPEFPECPSDAKETFQISH